MNRRNFSLGFLTILFSIATALLIAAHFRHEWQKRIDTARRDLQIITQAELRHIEKQREFAGIDELVSSGELGPEMRGRNGYVYSIHLEGNGISASATPSPEKNLPGLVNHTFGPGIAPLLAKLKNPGLTEKD